MRAVDTNVVLRAILRDDGKQASQADAFASGGAWISLVVLAETAWYLHARSGLDAATIARSIDMLLQHADFVVQDEETVALALAQFRRHPSVGFGDCLILEIARRAGHTPLGTFDRRLGRLPGAERL